MSPKNTKTTIWAMTFKPESRFQNVPDRMTSQKYVNIWHVKVLHFVAVQITDEGERD